MLRRKALLKRLRTTTPSKTEARLERVAASINSNKPILSGAPASRLGNAVVEPKYAPSIGSSQGLLSTRALQPIFLSPMEKGTPIDSANGSSPRKRTILRRLRTSRRSTSDVRVLNRQGDIRKLRSYLQHEDVVLIAIDTESETQGLLTHVVEVGLSVLRTRDIHNIKPGAHVKNWIAKVRHHHIVIDVTRHPRRRMRGSRFGSSRLLSPRDARDELLAIVKSSLADIGTVNIAFVGHSLGIDLEAVLQSPGLATDLLDISRPGHAVFDTLTLATAAEREGAYIPKKSLSGLARSLKVDPQYCDATGAVIGCHNASNDAAYTMMALLLFGAHWQDLVHVARPSASTITLNRPSTTKHVETAKSWSGWLMSVIRRILDGKRHISTRCHRVISSPRVALRQPARHSR